MFKNSAWQAMYYLFFWQSFFKIIRHRFSDHIEFAYPFYQHFLSKVTGNFFDDWP